MIVKIYSRKDGLVKYDGNQYLIFSSKSKKFIINHEYETTQKDWIEYKCDKCGEIDKTQVLNFIPKYMEHDFICKLCKRKETTIEKYGCENVFQNDKIKEKSKNKIIKKYGVENISQSKDIKKKKKETCLKNYGVEVPQQSKKIQEKTKKTCKKKYGYESIFQTEEFKKKARKTNKIKYGVEIPSKNKNIYKKIQETKRKNGTLNSSKIEDNVYEILNLEFPEILRSYRDEKRYPYLCDFYVPYYDLFIELHAHSSHGNEPFDKNNKYHLEKVEQWKDKKSEFYNNAITTWTVRDVEKFNIAKENNLNILFIYSSNIDEILSQIFNHIKVLPYRFLNYSYNNSEIEKEILNVYNQKNKGYSSLSQWNKTVLTYQPHFYEKENTLWKCLDIRKFIVGNRMKYLNKNKVEELNDKELLRGFKISGKHYGFSHFSPFWIKEFIREFNIKSIYDFCAGWGHRLLGVIDINYIGNDVDKRTYEGLIKINNKINSLIFKSPKKCFYNEDSSLFIPNHIYDAVFTCPPYYTTEIYNNELNSTNLYPDYFDWLNIWWKKSVQNSLINCKKYFAYVINDKYKNDMNNICLECNLEYIGERILGVSKSHFTKKSKSKESVQIFKLKQ